MNCVVVCCSFFCQVERVPSRTVDIRLQEGVEALQVCILHNDDRRFLLVKFLFVRDKGQVDQERVAEDASMKSDKRAIQSMKKAIDAPVVHKILHVQGQACAVRVL